MLKEEIHEKTRQNLEKKREHLQGFIDRFGAKASKATQAASKQKALDRIPALDSLKNLYQLDFKFNESPFFGEKMLEVNRVNFSYDSSPLTSPLIRQFSLIIANGKRTAFIGKNGRGKSTLLRLLANDLIPQEGEIKRSENLEIGYFGQTNIARLNPRLSIEEEISLANTQLTYTQVKGICGLMMFSGEKSKKSIAVLSGGEKSRVLLGKILAKRCNLLLLDEPTHHLDMESIEALLDAIDEFKGAVVIVTHSELILRRMNLDKLVVCHEQRQALFCGNYEEFLEKHGSLS